MTLRPFILAMVIMAASCTKTEVRDTGDARPISFSVTTRPSTKGYVTGTELLDISPDSLHTISSGGWRTLYLSGHISSGMNEGDYFTGEPFNRADGRWTHDPVLYWPISSTLNFIGYSSDSPFTGTACKWGRKDCSATLSLMVSSDYTQDDIVYGSAWGCSSSDGSAPVSMVLKHSQAWIQMRMKVSDASLDGVMTVDSVTVADIYTSGELDVENNYGDASATWNFRFETRSDTVMDDVHGAGGTPLTAAGKCLDMLIPEQEKKTITLHYHLAGSDVGFVHDIPLSLSTWLMGYRYIYDITVTLNGITVAPSVEEWTVEAEECDFV